MFFIQIPGRWLASWQLRFVLALLLTFFGPSVIIMHEVVFLFVLPMLVGMLIAGWKQKGIAVSETEGLRAYFLTSVGVLHEQQQAFKNAWFASPIQLQKRLLTLVGLKLAAHGGLLYGLYGQLHWADEWYANLATLLIVLYMLYALLRTLSLLLLVCKAQYQVIEGHLEAQTWFTFAHSVRQQPRTFFNLLFADLESAL
ncbi:hypothetical protein HZU75_08290 [Chitinibacter fontanus]|uniref:Uncharacterized protein n=1 Tax=Chitinibacter fontanus TaxID=1737446 RepID=A0A7D5ZD84_9NEIS|nr:hypothetical protein [Chitinibacter fontanus]QLI81526.1 hypothetical protein HZU75_08290 [Chitinibacter fontanus]